MPDSYIQSLRKRIGTDCIHVPGVRAIILNKQGQVLLQRRTDMQCWGLPAGAVELEDTVFQALQREVMEETGLEVLEGEPMAIHSGPSQRFQYPNGDCVQGYAITFIVRQWRGVPKADGVEGSEVAFWPLDALPADLLPIHSQTLHDFKNYRGHFIVSGHSETGDIS